MPRCELWQGHKAGIASDVLPAPTHRYKEHEMSIALFAVAAFFLFGVFLMISQSGKPRKPSTPGVIAVTTFINLAIICIITAAAFQLL